MSSSFEKEDQYSNEIASLQSSKDIMKSVQPLQNDKISANQLKDNNKQNNTTEIVYFGPTYKVIDQGKYMTPEFTELNIWAHIFNEQQAESQHQQVQNQDGQTQNQNFQARQDGNLSNQQTIIDEKIQVAEKRIISYVDQRIKDAEQRIEQKIQSLEQRIEQKIQSLEQSIENILNQQMESIKQLKALADLILNQKINENTQK